MPVIDKTKKMIARRINWRLFPWQRRHVATILGWKIWL